MKKQEVADAFDQLEPAVKREILVKNAINSALYSVAQEHRQEILTRARLILEQAGITVTNNELGEK